jgi:hypothetical protein
MYLALDGSIVQDCDSAVTGIDCKAVTHHVEPLQRNYDCQLHRSLGATLSVSCLRQAMWMMNMESQLHLMGMLTLKTAGSVKMPSSIQFSDILNDPGVDAPFTLSLAARSRRGLQIVSCTLGPTSSFI